MKKVGVVVLTLSIVLILSILVSGYVIFNSYFKDSNQQPVQSQPKKSTSSAPSTPSRCYYVAQNDTYKKPDFERLKTVMANQPIVRDVPKKGKISLKFFHFTEGCRIWDKSYLLNDGKIIESGEKGDIQVWLSSFYVDKIDENNFCDIVKEARDNGDLGQWSDLEETTLLWRYKSMIKYRECLGIKIGQ